MRLFSSPGRRPWVLTVCVALWLTWVGNVTLWKTLLALPELTGAAIASGPVFVFFACLGVVITGLLVALLALLTIPYLYKPMLTVFLLIAAVCTYFMWTYGVVIDRGMIINALQTDSKETLELLNLRMLGIVFGVIFIPTLIVWRSTVAYARGLKQIRNNLLLATASLALVALAALLSFQTLSSVMRNHTQIRHLITPLNAIWGLGGAMLSQSSSSKALTLIGQDATLAVGRAPVLLVLVLGETARSDHFSLNGYERLTNPKLSQEAVLSFKNVRSCGTNTAASVPCMFSHLGREDYTSSGERFENLLDILQKAGLAVLWIDNQAGCKGVCDRVPSVSTSNETHPAHCKDGECRDTVMLTKIDAALDQLPVDARAKGVVVVMHQMGSHGPAYYKRSNADHKLFQPECVNNALNTCSQAQVINAYDNTLVATDDFLAQTIAWLNKQAGSYDASLLYVSDHGESLGENNIYLHGLPYRFAPSAQTHVPWIHWQAKRVQSLDMACLAKQTQAPLSHDYYFHTILGITGVQTSLYKASLDAYAACRVAKMSAR